MVKVNFVDFWEEFDPTQDPIFGTFLRKHYGAEISEAPDFLFFSDLGTTHRQRRWNKCTKVFYTAENRGTPRHRTLMAHLFQVLCRARDGGHEPSQTPSSSVDFNCCDFAISHHYVDDRRHLRLPNYVRRYGLEKLQCLKRPKRASDILERKKAFCCFVYSNDRSDLPGVKLRNDFFRMLCQYCKVDSAGKVLNNMEGYTVPRDLETYLEFISKYKFVIAFENSQGQGYTTEKIFHPMLANTLAVYWGNPKVHLDFNERSFVNCHGFENFASVVKRIMEIDQDDGLYLDYMLQPYLRQGGYLEGLCEKTLLQFFDRVFYRGK